jgi:hypothetical protein
MGNVEYCFSICFLLFLPATCVEDTAGDVKRDLRKLPAKRFSIVHTKYT